MFHSSCLSYYIIILHLGLSIIEIYVRHARPKVACCGSGDYLFLNSRGQRFTQLGRCVIKFFHKETPLHITTTTLRSVTLGFSAFSNLTFLRKLQQTETRDAVRKKLITEAEEEAMTLVQGHTSETVKMFYQKDDMREAAGRVIGAHRTMFGEAESSLKMPKGNEDDSAYEVGNLLCNLL